MEYMSPEMMYMCMNPLRSSKGYTDMTLRSLSGYTNMIDWWGLGILIYVLYLCVRIEKRFRV